MEQESNTIKPLDKWVLGHYAGFQKFALPINLMGRESIK